MQKKNYENSLVKRNVWDELKQSIETGVVNEKDRKKIYRNLMKLKEQKINMLITGATGSGKSSTINALFDADVSKVGYGVDPETRTIEKYTLDNLILWDSPGLGDSPEADRIHSENIVRKINENGPDGNALIDLVLVIIDGSSKDMGTSFDLINNYIIPNMQDAGRVLIAINQCDAALKGKGWDREKCAPSKELEDFLEQKVRSVKRRVYESTGVDIEPVYYSALERYNLSKLLNFIVCSTPEEKRVVYMNNVNRDPEVFEHDDRRRDYNHETRERIGRAVAGGIGGAAAGAATGALIGSFIPGIGTTVGAVAGGIIGGAASLFSALFG